MSPKKEGEIIIMKSNRMNIMRAFSAVLATLPIVFALTACGHQQQVLPYEPTTREQTTAIQESIEGEKVDLTPMEPLDSDIKYYSEDQNWTTPTAAAEEEIVKHDRIVEELLLSYYFHDGYGGEWLYLDADGSGYYSGNKKGPIRFDYNTEIATLTTKDGTIEMPFEMRGDAIKLWVNTAEYDTILLLLADPERWSYEDYSSKCELSEVYAVAEYDEVFHDYQVTYSMTVTNTSKDLLFLEELEVVIKDSNGNYLLEPQILYPSPETLEPGKTAAYYGCDEIDFQPQGEIIVLPFLKGVSAGTFDESEELYYPVSNVQRRSNWDDAIVTGLVENNTDTPSGDVRVEVIAYDKDGIPIGTASTSIPPWREIEPHSSEPFEVEVLIYEFSKTYKDIARYDIYAR